MNLPGPFAPPDPEFEARVRASFACQGAMATLAARLARVAPGEAEVELVPHPGVAQQGGFVHGGVLAAIADSACGYAALTLAAPGREVVSVEVKMQFLRPSGGALVRARGRVLKPGRSLTACLAQVEARDAAGAWTLTGFMTATMAFVGTARGGE